MSLFAATTAIVHDLSIAACALAALPFGLTIWNSCLLRRLPPLTPGRTLPRLSVLIPARDEAATIIDCLNAVAANGAAVTEIIVLDDHSTDATGALIEGAMRHLPNLRLLRGQPLPPGWIGKTFACQQLADAATGEVLLFLDADVRVAPDAIGRLLQRAVAQPRFSLLAAVPRQLTGSWAERLLIPLIPYLIMGYLPVWQMRRSLRPGFGVATGQLLMLNAAIYRQVGGHAAIRGFLHDGLKLARRWRDCGHLTDLVAGHDLAAVRMYADAAGTWRGLAKNAREGMARPVALTVWTFLLAGGHLLPWLLLIVAPGPLPLAACLCSLASRLLTSLPRGESAIGAVLHPVGIALTLLLQFWALCFPEAVKRVGWRGRVYPT